MRLEPAAPREIPSPAECEAADALLSLELTPADLDLFDRLARLLPAFDMADLKATAANIINTSNRAEALADRLAEDPATDDAEFVAVAADAYRARIMRRLLREEFTRRRLTGAH
jgi:hypothetical protein